MSEKIQNWLLGINRPKSPTNSVNGKEESTGFKDGKKLKHKASLNKARRSESTICEDDATSSSRFLGSRRASNINRNSSLNMKNKSKPQVQETAGISDQSAISFFLKGPAEISQDDRSKIKRKFKEAQMEKRRSFGEASDTVQKKKSVEKSAPTKIREKAAVARVKNSPETILSQLKLLLSGEEIPKKSISKKNHQGNGSNSGTTSNLMKGRKNSNNFQEKEVVRLYTARNEAGDTESFSSTFCDEDLEEEEEYQQQVKRNQQNFKNTNIQRPQLMQTRRIIPSRLKSA